MERVVTVVEAKRDFSELMARVAYSGERLVVERHGKPMVAWISYDDLRRLEQLEQQGAALQERRLAGLKLAKQSRRRIADERANELLPDSADILNSLREQRIDDLTGLR